MGMLSPLSACNYGVLTTLLMLSVMQPSKPEHFYIAYVFSIIDVVSYFPNLQVHGHNNCGKKESMGRRKKVN